MNAASDAKATRLFLFVVGTIFGVPAAVLTSWSSAERTDELEHTALFWGCLVVSCVCALMVLLSLISFAVSLGRSARSEQGALDSTMEDLRDTRPE